MKFLLAILTVAVFISSCVTTQNTSGEDFDEGRTKRIGDRVYVEDPYYGTVVLERDPFTGRYYDVTYGYRGYGSPYNTWNTSRRYGNYGRHYRNNSGVTIQRPSQEQNQPKREEARKKILGN